jgi:hypothetical protein
MEKVKKQGVESLFVPYEIALALKELGFDEKCCAAYYKKYNNEIGYHKIHRDFNFVTLTVSAPTFSQAFRWFREKYHIVGYPIFKGGKTQKTSWYDYIIYSEIDWENNNPNQQWKTYEEAELECLKKLIEIVKK